MGEQFPQQWIVVSGDLIDGFNFYGPFDDNEAAISWAEDQCPGEDWHVVVLVRA